MMAGEPGMERTVAKPSWIDQGAMDTAELDLTGARLPPQALEARLLDDSKRPVSPAFLTGRRPVMIGVRQRCADPA